MADEQKLSNHDILVKRIPNKTVDAQPAFAQAVFLSEVSNDGVFNGQGITFSDSFAMDAFGRLRVSEPETLLGGSLSLSNQPLFWDEYTSGSATTLHLPNLAAVRLSTPATAGGLAIRQSKQYCPYQPGKSQQILATFVFGDESDNLIRRVGYFDDRNGIFLQQDENGLAFVRRSYASGTAIDYAVRQDDWSLDTMDGSGKSGLTLDPADTQIFYCDLEWLGVGRVRTGFVVNGLVYYAHEFLNTNVMPTVYMSTASLPVRYEQRTIGTGTASSMDCICAAVASEGGQNIKEPIFAVSNGSTLISVTNVQRPILSIRVGEYFPASGTVLNRSVVQPLSATIFSEDAPVFYQVLLNPTLGGESWKAFDIVNSGVQYDISATGSVGGTIIDAGYVATTNQSKSAALNQLETNILLALNIEGNSGDILTVSAVRIGGTSSDCSAVIQWKEIY